MEEIGAGTKPPEITSSETYSTTVDSSRSMANEITREEEELDVKLKKIDIQKILRSVITNQDEETVKHEISCEEEYMLFKLLSEATKELVNINRLDHKECDESIEFEFGRVVEKLDQHSVHCPKCNFRITKVVLRKKTRTKPCNLFGCFSCFSIFIPEETEAPSHESVSPGTAVCEPAPSTNRVVPPGGRGDHAINIEEGSGTIERGASIITLDEEGSKTLEILKSVVYGGLMESMSSLSVVSSAAAADATTMNIVAMGLANLIGGLCIIGPNLRELKNEGSRYKELLGQTDNFLLHATVAVLAFLIFGLIPPVTYGFSFRQTDDKDLKLVVVAAASLLCIAILAIGKAYIQKKPNFYAYIKTVLYYIGMAVMASGISYAAGELIKRLVEKLGWFDSSVAVTLSLPQVQSVNPAWGSY
ncbi:membrane protein of ER body 2-like isoform X1 [Camellia sinensis]|uniref:membrane protein of ER body 2-like isoform X1 n=1 Tax=Camellia sinensis TaxID=4442 RepID=UPI00103553CE|nr:membrane protein of ER body 2-like isoform X1 [Camellia sinensis]